MKKTMETLNTKVTITTSTSDVSSYRSRTLQGILNNIDNEITANQKEYERIVAPVTLLNAKFKHINIELL